MTVLTPYEVVIKSVFCAHFATVRSNLECSKPFLMQILSRARAFFDTQTSLSDHLVNRGVSKLKSEGLLPSDLLVWFLDGCCNVLGNASVLWKRHFPCTLLKCKDKSKADITSTAAFWKRTVACTQEMSRKSSSKCREIIKPLQNPSSRRPPGRRDLVVWCKW